MSWATHAPFSWGQVFFEGDVLFHELSENLVLAPELGFQHGDPLPLGVGPGAAGPLETRRSVLEQGLLPAVELRGLDAQILTQVGDGNLLEQVAP